MAVYLLHLLTLGCILAIAVVSLQLLVSTTGLLSVAHAVFLGIGAYAAGIGVTLWHFTAIGEIGLAIVCASIISLMVSVPSLRLREDYFAISTFGLQMIASGVLLNWMPVTNGPLGIGGIGQLSIGGFSVKSSYPFFLLVLFICSVAVVIAESINASRYGLILRAIRSDELFAQSLGKRTLWFKVKIVALSAVLTSIAGVLYAHFLTYIDPSSFSLMDSVQVLSMVVIGGTRPLGAVAGTMILVLLPEALRFLGLPAALAANIRQVLYGVLIVVVVAFRPRGIFSFHERTAA
ncbi:MAG TPA: branched-chain amino acid ABC transporter permease [Bryobacteraceae bacterium]|jgi:branched-chain amino acid transport system permease protein